MMRRSLLRMLAGLPMVSGDLSRGRPMNAPPATPYVPGVQPGAFPPVIITNKVIVFGPTGAAVGVFVYTPGTTPGLGNPPISWMSGATADPFGNPLNATVGVAGTGTFRIGNLLITPTTISAVANPLAVNGFNIGRSAVNNDVQVTTPTPLNFNTAIISAQPIAASHPGTIDTLETWQAMTLINAWQNDPGQVTAQYRLNAAPVNTVEIIGALLATTATATTFFTLPAAYTPAHTQQFACGGTGGVLANNAPFITVDNAGNCSVQRGTIGAANIYPFHGLISLDA